MKFFEDTHKYYKNNIDFISSSQVVERFTQPFDEAYWSLYKAYEEMFARMYNISAEDYKGRKKFMRKLVVKFKGRGYKYGDYSLFKKLESLIHDKQELYLVREQIKLQWKEKNRLACEKGSKYHAMKEDESKDRGWEHNSWLDKSFTTLESFFWEDSNVKVSTINLDMLKPGFYSELMLYWAFICGQIDRVWINQLRHFWIRDWKTNEKISMSNPHQKMKYPLEHLDDCNYNHYRIQLSIYAWMLVKRGYICKGLALDHYDEPYFFDPLFDEVEAIFEYLKQEREDNETNSNSISLLNDLFNS